MSSRNVWNLESDRMWCVAGAERLRAIVESSPEPIIELDLDWNVRSWNAAAERTFGWRADEVVGRPVPFVPEDRRTELASLRERRITDQDPSPYETVRLHKDGTPIDVRISAAVLRDGTGAPSGTMAIVTDVRARQRAQERIAAENVVMRAAADERTLDTFAPRILRGLCETLGWDAATLWLADEVTGALACRELWMRPATVAPQLEETTHRWTLVPGHELPGRARAAGSTLWVADLAAERSSRRAAIAVSAGFRSAVYVPLTGAPDGFGVLELLSCQRRVPSDESAETLTDIANRIGLFVERQRATEELTRQSLRDRVTGLPNRAWFEQQLDQTLRLEPWLDGVAAVLIVGLRRFREVNSAFGHDTGDLLLREVGQRLRATLDDTLPLARLDADQFGILVPGGNAAAASLLAQHVLAALTEPFQICDTSIYVDAAIGSAVHSESGAEAEVLLRRAEAAMHAAKTSIERYLPYTAAQDAHSAERVALLGDLRRALANDQLVLEYQPVASAKTGRVIGVEALVRWCHPQRGMVPPGEFIPLAEQTGLIRPITQWVLGAALAQCRAWRDSGLALTVSVNLSAWDLLDTSLPDRISGALATTQLEPATLTVEITESVLMAEPKRAKDTLTRLSALGVRVAIDDFGTGYSSLAYLNELPVDVLKIDRAFIRSLTSDTRSAAIVHATVDLGHALGFDVVAEGIEDRGTLEAVAMAGCDEAQGYYLARPLPGPSVAAWVREHGTSEVTAEPRVEAANVGGEQDLPRLERGHGKTVLVVDDDDSVRRLASRILSLAGYRVLEASRPSQALRICQEHAGTVDIVLTDMSMPEMPGSDLAPRIVALRPHVKVVYMSGHTRNAIGMVREGVPFLAKPFTARGLVRSVEEMFVA